MTENELREMLGDELFNGLSKDDKELILNTAGKFNFDIWHTRADKPHSPQPFYVIDKELGELVTYPTGMVAINTFIEDGDVHITRENLYFGIDCYGELLILNRLGKWILAPEKYIYVFNSDYWT